METKKIYFKFWIVFLFVIWPELKLFASGINCRIVQEKVQEEILNLIKSPNQEVFEDKCGHCHFPVKKLVSHYGLSRIKESMDSGEMPLGRDFSPKETDMVMTYLMSL